MAEMNLPMKQTHRHREQTGSCQGVGEGWHEYLGLANADSYAMDKQQQPNV